MSIESTEDGSFCLLDEDSRVCASVAFCKLLNTLGLHEFPCGLGNWRADECYSKCDVGKGQNPCKCSTSLRDYGAEKETTDALVDLISSKRSPWKVDCEWSSDAETLREIAVRCPQIINEKFIYNHFRSLRIVDRRVSEVDVQISRFKNLENLNLNANFLHSLDSRNLPKRLETLELFGNQIDDLSGLCLQLLPQLLHLGLGGNEISSTDHHITGQYCSQLLSLDLGHNHLVDLVDLINQLETLPKLQHLILTGNPLCLVPAYRIYVIDRLGKLKCFDDVIVLTDEKLSAQGSAYMEGDCLNKAEIHLSIPFIKGLPVPQEILYPEDQPEFPHISRKYFVKLMLIGEDGVTSDQQQNSDKTNQEQELHNEMTKSNLNVTVQQADKPSPCPPAKSDQSQILSEFTCPVSQSIAPMQGHMDNCMCSFSSALIPIVTPSNDWMQEIELKWTETVVRSKLLPLRNFIKDGMTISVVEEKILSYPALEDENTEIEQGGKGQKDKKATGKQKSPSGDKKGKKSPKEKEIPVKGKGSKDTDAKKTKKQKDDSKKNKGKKKDLDVELIQCPPEYQTIAAFHMALDGFLDGTYECEKTFSKEMTRETPTPSASPSPERTNKKDKKDKRKGKQSNEKKQSKEKKQPNEKKQSSPKKVNDTKSQKKAGKGKAGKGKGFILIDGNEPPPPLEVQVMVKLQHWKTAADAVISDEPSQ